MEITHLIPAVSLENGQQRLDHDQTRNAMESHDDPSEDGKDDDGDHRDGGEEVPDEEDGPPNWYQYCLSNRSARKMIKDALPLAISQRIPLDIFYVVMEQLRGEPKNLYNCALVCHAWHQHSISTLYSTIAITNRDVFDTLVSAARLPEVQGYLSSTKEIIVEENGWGGRGHLFVERPSTASYFHLIPLMLANHLPSLRHLILRHCGQCHDIVRYPANFGLRLLVLRQITCLTLSDIRMANFTHLRSLVCAFPSLEELSIEDVLLSNHTVSTSKPMPGRLRLRILHIAARTKGSEVAFFAFVKVLRLSPAYRSIWKLRVSTRNSMQNMYAVYAACRELAETLRDSLRCLLWDDPNGMFGSLSLPQLTHLELRLTLSLSLGRPRILARHLHRLLSREALPDHQITRIVLILTLTSADRSHDVQAWVRSIDTPSLRFTEVKVLWDALLASSWSQLRDVDLHLKFDWTDGALGAETEVDATRDIVKVIRHVLSPWTDRGILRVMLR